MRASWLVVQAVALLSASGAWAQPSPPKPLFATHDVVHIVIKAPFHRLDANRSLNAPAMDATLIAPETSSEALPIRLSVRGVTRRRKDVCDFPPLRIDFPDRPPETSLFAGQKKLKLAVHCLASASAQRYILLEYAAFRIANVVTPVSFNVRLAQVDYEEPDGRPVVSRFAFFIENDKDVAKRNGLHLAETPDRIPVSALNPEAAARDALFQYLIGNVDWSMIAGHAGEGCCHNTKLLGQKGASTDLIPVPYDFDSAGMVAPPYAAPPLGLPIEDVRERLYRGSCRHRSEAQALAASFLDRRTAILAVMGETPDLDPSARHEAESYLGQFFDQIARDPSLASLFKTCLASAS